MKFGPVRGHPIYIFERFIVDFAPMMAVVIFSVVRGNFDLLTSNAATYVIILAAPFNRIATYLTTTYEIDDVRLTVKTGWLVKKNMEVPLSTITTVDASQSVIQKLIGAVKLNIDNASNVAGTATKITMTFSEENARKIKELLKPADNMVDGANIVSDGAETHTETGRDYLFKAKDLLIMGAIRSKGAALLKLYVLASGAFSFIAGFITVSDSKAAQWLEMEFEALGITASLIIAFAAVMVIAVIAGSIGTYIKYYGFHVMDSGDAIKIKYGLFTQKSYTIQKKKISGFYYTQSLFMRLLKTGTLYCFAIGYGGGGDDDTREDPIIVPLIRDSELRMVMARLLPEMQEVSPSVVPGRGTQKYFFYSATMVFAAIVLAATISLSIADFWAGSGLLWIIGAVCFAMGIVGALMQKKNTSLSSNASNVTMTYGGFKKTTVCVKTRNIETVSARAGLFKARKGIKSVSIGFIAPLATAGATAKNLPDTAVDMIRSDLIF